MSTAVTLTLVAACLHASQEMLVHLVTQPALYTYFKVTQIFPMGWFM